MADFFSGSEDQVNAVELLTADHRKVEDLFSQVRENEDANNRRIFEQIRRELETHTHIEEQIFYPHLLKVGDEKLQNLTREALAEHGQVKTVLQELSAPSEDREDFRAQLTVLMEDVEHHVEEEENEMFPLVRNQVDEDALLRLGSLMETEKRNFSQASSRTASAGG